MTTQNMEYQALLHGAIDLHIHTSPSVFPRYEDDLAVAEQAANWGIAGFVLKAHEGSSAERAYLINTFRPGCGAIGSIVLNHFVGGLNPSAVEVALAQGARVVWFPSIHAANHLRHYGGPTYSAMSSALPPRPVNGITLFDEAGTLRSEVVEIIDLVRDADAVLATGHIGAEEVFAVVKMAQERHLERVVVTHPDLDVTGLDLETQVELARLGAYLELTALNHLPEWGGLPYETVVGHIDRIGSARFVLSSDLGQKTSGEPWERFALELMKLQEAGVHQRDLVKMLHSNPRDLLS